MNYTAIGRSIGRTVGRGRLKASAIRAIILKKAGRYKPTKVSPVRSGINSLIRDEHHADSVVMNALLDHKFKKVPENRVKDIIINSPRFTNQDRRNRVAKNLWTMRKKHGRKHVLNVLHNAMNK